MNIFNKVGIGLSNIISPSTKQLSSNNSTSSKNQRILPWKLKSTSKIKNDIRSWERAYNNANAEDSKNFDLQLLFEDVRLDSLLNSQIENRINRCLGADFSLVNNKGEVDQQQTDLLRKMTTFRKITREILNSNYYGYSLVELQLVKMSDNTFNVHISSIPRTNVVPQTGKFYPDYSEDKFILYRTMDEYGTYILEFEGNDRFGLLNKAIPHILMKRFAQSCWSELCEIYGIPPRVMKTNTQDPVMLERAEAMMRDTGAAAWYIIDEHEKFEWATGVDTNGDVYKNLITLCSNETSMLISGAIIGQDTVNGSNSKEKASQDILSDLVKADKVYVEECWNNQIIPALIKLGILKKDVIFRFDAVEDLGELWTRTKDTFPFMNVNPEFVKTKFGIDVLGLKDNTNGGNSKLKIDDSFFV
jgi:hypothetical protein